MDWSFRKEFRTHTFEFSKKTKTTEEQTNMEELLNDTHYNKIEIFKDDYNKLFKVIHMKFCKANLFNLPQSYESLDASQTWLIYWSLHSLKLLEFVIPEKWKLKIIQDLIACQHPKGGFGGGPYQIAHLATTYGAILALVELEDVRSFELVDKKMMYEWISRIKQQNGAFSMHECGELDVRGCYCALTVAKLCGLEIKNLFKGTAEWIASCQTYEGGFGGAPGLEAHGGYTFCALASLIELGSEHLIDLNKLLKWTVARQMSCEGGFQGRTNKMVDSCYSFWVGGNIPLIHSCLASNYNNPLFDINALHDYLLISCQCLSGPVDNPNGGGIIDKPGKKPDPYHTCNALSGLAISQKYRSWCKSLAHGTQKHYNALSSATCSTIDNINLLCDNHVTFNITKSAYAFHCDNFLNI